MNGESRAPTTTTVIAAIARREIGMALKRKLVKMLFLGNLIPPLVMALYLVVEKYANERGIQDLDFNPLAELLQMQAFLVLILALGIGTMLVARDRAEDVLFLYATRPVTPWSYTIGKMLAVAAPAVALLVLPAIVMALMHLGLQEGFSFSDFLLMIGKAALIAVLIAGGFAGITVGPSAVAKKARWALLLTFACFLIPSIAASVIWRHSDEFSLEPWTALEDMIASLFEGYDAIYGVEAAICLVVWCALGALVTSMKVRREMIP